MTRFVVDRGVVLHLVGEGTYDAAYVALTQLQADASVTLDTELARRVEGIVSTATVGALPARGAGGHNRGVTSGTTPAPVASERSEMPESPVRELRLALTVERYDEAVAFYRDRLGLPVIESFEGPGGGGVVLDAGRATLELLSVGQAELVDQVEVGSRVAGPVRVALEVADSAALARRLVAGGAEALADPVVTPWSHRNVRLRAPEGTQLTLFTVLEDAGP